MASPPRTVPRSVAGIDERIVGRLTRVAVIGQGYVGLALATAAAQAGFSVVGIDIDATLVEGLSHGGPVLDISEPALARGIRSGHLAFSTDPAPIREADLIFICVPTPLKDGAPDLSFVETASHTASTHLQPGSLVILESTTYPGTTEQRVLPILEEGSGLRAGEDFLLAYSPERIDPGNTEFGMRNTPRVVGGSTPEATAAAVAFYEQIVDRVLAVSTTRAAETAKLLENTFRHINIALVNELTMLCHEMGIDVWEVIEAAATKPFGFMPFFPGPGIGGHCIPLDPTYLGWEIRREAGRRFSLLEQAQDVNERMPDWVASRVGEILNDRGRAVKDAHLLVLGVTYKADVADVRESPSIRVMQALHRKGAHVSFHDFYVEEVPLNGDLIRRVEDLDAAVAEADCVLLLTPHGGYDLEWIADRARVVFDTRNAYGSAKHANIVTL